MSRFHINSAMDVGALVGRFGGILIVTGKNTVVINDMDDKTLPKFLAALAALSTMIYTVKVNPEKEFSVFIESEIFNFG